MTRFSKTKNKNFILATAIGVGALLAGCGKKMTLGNGDGAGGGNGYSAIRSLQCNITSVMNLAQDSGNVSLRIQYLRPAGNAIAKSIELDSFPAIDLAAQANGVGCTGTDGSSQILTVTVPYTGTSNPSKIRLNMLNNTTQSTVSCESQAIVQTNPFGDIGMACQSSPSGATATAPSGVVTMNASQFGTTSRYSVASTETPAANATTAPVYLGIIDLGNGSAPKPIGVGPMTSPSALPTVVYNTSDELTAPRTVNVRVLMFNSQGKRSVVQKSITLGNTAPTGETSFVEDSRGILVPNFANLPKPKAIPPNDIIVVGKGAGGGDQVVGYHLPSGKKIYQANVFVSTSSNQKNKGNRVALGDVDGSGNLSVVVSQEAERHLEVLNADGRMVTHVNIRQYLEDYNDVVDNDPNLTNSQKREAKENNVDEFDKGAHTAIYLDNGGAPRIAITTKRKEVVGLKWNPAMAQFQYSRVSTSPLGNGVNVDDDLRVAGLGQNLAFIAQSDNQKNRFGIFNLLQNFTGNQATGETPYVAMGYEQPKLNNSVTVIGSRIKEKQGNKDMQRGKITVLKNGANPQTIDVFENVEGGVRVATTDFNGDGISDFVVARGKDGNDASGFVIIDGKTMTKINAETVPFPGFKGGLYVAGHITPR